MIDFDSWLADLDDNAGGPPPRATSSGQPSFDSWLSDLDDKSGKVPMRAIYSSPGLSTRGFGGVSEFTGGFKPDVEYVEDWKPYSIPEAMLYARTDPEIKRMGAAKYFLERMPFVGGASKAADLYGLVEAAGRIRDGKATEQDQIVLGAYLAEAEDSKDKTWASKVFDVASAIPGFGVEFAMTGGAYTGGKKLAEKGVEAAMGQAAKSAAGRAVAATVPRAIGVGAQTMASPQLIASSVAKQMVPKFDLSADESGQIQDIVVGDDPSFTSAMVKGFGDAAIELGSERGGEIIGSALSKLPGAARLSAMKSAVINRYLGGGRTMRDFRETFKKVGWDGIVSEMTEERLGEVARGATGIEDDYGTTGKLATDPVEALRELSVEAGAFALPGSGAVASSGLRGLAERPMRQDRMDSLRGKRAIQQTTIDQAMRPESVAAWVDANPEKAATIAESPSRTQWEKQYGLPSGTGENQRRRFAGMVRGIVAGENSIATAGPDVAGDAVGPDLGVEPTGPGPDGIVDEPAMPDVGADQQRPAGAESVPPAAAESPAEQPSAVQAGDGAVADEFDWESLVDEAIRPDADVAPAEMPAPAAEEAAPAMPEADAGVAMEDAPAEVPPASEQAGPEATDEAPPDVMQLYEGSLPAIWKAAERMVRSSGSRADRQEANIEAAKSDAATKVLEAVRDGKYDPSKGDFAAWASEVARNEVSNRRRRGRDKADQIPTTEEGRPVEPVSQEAGPAEMAIRNEEAQQVSAALRELPAEDRAVLERTAAGDTGEQIAGDLGVTKSAVSQRKAAAEQRALAAIVQARRSGRKVPAAIATEAESPVHVQPTKLQTAAADARVELEAARANVQAAIAKSESRAKRTGSRIGGKRSGRIGADPEKLAAYANLLKATLKSKVYDFAAFVERVVKQFGRQFALDNADEIRANWDKVRAKAPKLSASSDVGELLAGQTAAIVPERLQSATIEAPAPSAPSARPAPAASRQPPAGPAPHGTATPGPESAAAPPRRHRTWEKPTEQIRQEAGQALFEGATAPVSQGGATGLYNAAVDALRALRGDEALTSEEMQEAEQWLADAQAKENGLAESEMLVKSLLASPRAITPVEHAGILLLYQSYKNQYAAAAKDLTAKHGGDPALESQAQTVAEFAAQQLRTIEQAERMAGTEAGRSLAARKLQIKEDFSYAGMLTNALAARGGKAFDPNVPADVAALKQIEEDAKTIERLQAELAAEKSKGEKRTGKRTEAARKRIDAAWDNLWSVYHSSPASGLNVMLVGPAVELVRAYADLGVAKFEDFMAQLRADKGAAVDDLQDVLQVAWDQENAPKERKPREPATDDQRLKAKEQALAREIEKMQADLDAGRIERKRKGLKLESPRILEIETKLKELRKQREDMRKASPEFQASEEARKQAAVEKGLETRIGKEKKRLADEDFGPKEPKSPRKISQREMDLRHELAQVKAKSKARETAWREARMTRVGKGLLLTKRSIEVFRAFRTSFDFSAVLAQGAYASYAHPILAAKAAGKMFRATGIGAMGEALVTFLKNPLTGWKKIPGIIGRNGERVMFEIIENINSRQNAPLYEKAKLAVPRSEEAAKMQEEAFLGPFSKLVPGVASSERAYNAFLWSLRADMFDAMAESVAAGGQITIPQAKVIARWVNAFTGRGELGNKLGVLSSELATVFFSPRYFASRLQLAAGPVTTWFEKDAKVRKAIQAEYVKSLAGLSVLYGAAYILRAMWPDDDEENKPVVEWDSRSSDFGKVRFGNVRIDPLAGMAQTSVFLSRVISGKNKTQAGAIVPIRGEDRPHGGKTVGDVTGDFLKSKFSPIAGITWAAISGNGFGGAKLTPAYFAENLLVPMSFMDAYENLKQNGVEAGTALTMLSLFGMRTATYQEGEVGMMRSEAGRLKIEKQRAEKAYRETLRGEIEKKFPKGVYSDLKISEEVDKLMKKKGDDVFFKEDAALRRANLIEDLAGELGKLGKKSPEMEKLVKPYLTGLSRFGLRMKPADGATNPLTAKDMPREVKELVDDHLGRAAVAVATIVNRKEAKDKDGVANSYAAQDYLKGLIAEKSAVDKRRLDRLLRIRLKKAGWSDQSPPGRPDEPSAIDRAVERLNARLGP